MRKVIMLMLICLVFTITVIEAKKLATLEELAKPDMMIMGTDRLYFTEGASIYIYSFKDFRFVKKFGKKGEGPREFNVSQFSPPLLVIPYDNKLLVNSNAKVSFFTVDGEFIEEFRVAPLQVFLPFGSGYVGTGNAVDEKDQIVLSLNLYNAKFEKKKELYKSDMVVGTSVTFNFPLNSFDFPVYKDKIYIIAGKEGFVIDVFDHEGEKLYRIKKDYKQLKVPEEYKKRTLKWYEHNFRQFWDFFKDRISFKTYYPAVQRMTVTDDRIYILTYKKKKEDTECIILDLKGKEQKRVYVPFPQVYGTEIPIFNIINNCFYYLVENEEEETWELHVEKLSD